MYHHEYCIYSSNSKALQKIGLTTKKNSSDEKYLKDIESENTNIFWQFWQQHQEYFYNCCLQWMNGNPEEAQEALSEAMLKAWEKFPQHREKILNPKQWLTKLIHNLCVDLHRQKDKERKFLKTVKLSLKEHYFQQDISDFDISELEVSKREILNFIFSEIISLPIKIRTPFILRCYKHYSYYRISQNLAISQDNIRKQVQQARKILREKISQYMLSLESEKKIDFELICESVCEPVCESDFELNFELSLEKSCSVLKDNPLDKREELKSITSKSNSKSNFKSNLIQQKKSSISNDENQQIDYQVSIICLETLPHGWYPFHTPLVWR